MHSGIRTLHKFRAGIIRTITLCHKMQNRVETYH